MVDPAYVALVAVPGIGRVRLQRLLQRFGTADRVLSAAVGALRAVPGMSLAAATAVTRASVSDGIEVLRRVETLGGVALDPAHPSFPEALATIPDAPPLLYALGRLEALQQPSVAIVGSRDHSPYGADVAAQLASHAARAGLVVVSGMARGLDAVAHRAALDAGGASVGVLGNGLGVVYPAANRALYDDMRERGCLLTEHPPGERPNAGSFPRRNRLISGLARATVVVEARVGSGALITSDCALAQGREVMAVPGPITDPRAGGTNRLIQMGAKPILSVDDLLEEYGASADRPELTLPSDLSDGERRALDALATGAGQIDQIAARIDAPTGEVLAWLTSLEIRGVVQQRPGKVFVQRPMISE